MQEFSKRLNDLRTSHQWSMQALADLANVSKSMICKIESGDVQPTLDVASRLANAFGISLSEMLQPTIKQSILLIKKADQTVWQDPVSHMQRFILSPTYSGCKVEWIRVILPAKTSSGLLTGNKIQFKKKYFYLLDGELEVSCENAIYHLEKNDSFYFEAKDIHEVRNPGETPAEYFVVSELQ